MNYVPIVVFLFISYKQKMKKAIVIGATGLVGAQLIELLIENQEYSEIVTLVRRSSGKSNPKLSEHIINFDEQESWSNLIKGDVLFSAMGTTLAQAKTKEAQYKVDYTYQLTVAQLAAKNGVPHYVLVSAAGATPKSNNFYWKMKGQLEMAVQTLPFKIISLLKPGLITGDRVHNRPGEKIAFIILTVLNKLGLFKRYKPITGRLIAKAMIQAEKKRFSETYTFDEIFKLAETLDQ